MAKADASLYRRNVMRGSYSTCGLRSLIVKEEVNVPEQMVPYSKQQRVPNRGAIIL